MVLPSMDFLMGGLSQMSAVLLASMDSLMGGLCQMSAVLLASMDFLMGGLALCVAVISATRPLYFSGDVSRASASEMALLVLIVLYSVASAHCCKRTA